MGHDTKFIMYFSLSKRYIVKLKYIRFLLKKHEK